MKYIDWDQKKNEKLKSQRGISFEEIVEAIFFDANYVIKEHPNKEKYSNQKIFLVEIEDYIFVIPFVEDDEKLYLKTIFPSRKYTKSYVEKGDL